MYFLGKWLMNSRFNFCKLDKGHMDDHLLELDKGGPEKLAFFEANPPLFYDWHLDHCENVIGLNFAKLYRLNEKFEGLSFCPQHCSSGIVFENALYRSLVGGQLPVDYFAPDCAYKHVFEIKLVFWNIVGDHLFFKILF